MNRAEATPTRYDLYLSRQMQDPEFRAQYALAREKARLEILIAQLKEQIKQEKDAKTLLRSVNRLSRQVAKIAT